LSDPFIAYTMRWAIHDSLAESYQACLPKCIRIEHWPNYYNYNYVKRMDLPTENLSRKSLKMEFAKNSYGYHYMQYHH
jgi:hypothetical protein